MAKPLIKKTGVERNQKRVYIHRLMLCKRETGAHDVKTRNFAYNKFRNVVYQLVT